MARGGSGLRAVIKIAKIIDRAGKQAARESEKRRRINEKEALRTLKNLQELERHEEQQRIAREKAEEKEELRLERQRLAEQKAKESHRLRQEKQEALKSELTKKLKEKNDQIFEKQRIEMEKQAAQNAFIKRCRDRENVRNELIDRILK